MNRVSSVVLDDGPHVEHLPEVANLLHERITLVRDARLFGVDLLDLENHVVMGVLTLVLLRAGYEADHSCSVLRVVELVG